MNFHKNKVSKISLVLIIILTMAFVAFAQKEQPKNEPSTIVYSQNSKNLPIAMSNNLYCAGYVQRSASFNTKMEIVGADDEKDKHIYAEGDALYIRAGATDGVKKGDMFSVIRPRGKVKTKWSQKKGLGVYVQELGAVEVIKVMRDVSVARVKKSCDVILLGDLVTRVPNRVSPMFMKRASLDTFAMSSGKANGRIFMARDGQELVGRDQIVYVDLGREDNVSIGDYMTIYRPLGTGNIHSKVLKETLDNKEEGYETDRYRGERYSNQATRKGGTDGNGKIVTTKNAKKPRPELRKVVGELVILNVMERTATAVIVRTAGEIHTGDQVELQ